MADRRRRWAGLLASLLALAAVAFAPFARPLLHQEVFGAWGVLGAHPPWSAPLGQVNVLSDFDTVVLELPVTAFVHRTGATWDPYRGLGEPIGVGEWPTITHPLAWPLTRALAPGRGTLWLSFLQVLAGGAVCLLHLRWRGLGRAALAGAIAFELAPLFTAWAARPFITAAMPWGALTLWAADALARRPGPRPAAAFAGAVGGGLLCAFPQLTLTVSLAAAALAVAGAGRAWWRAAGWTALALALGALLAAARLAPLSAVMSWSSRAALPWSEWHARTAAIGPDLLWTLVAPDLTGHPLRGWLTPGEGVYANMQELRIYAGLPVLALALAGATAPGARRYAVAAAVALALALPTPLARLLWVIPGFAGSSPSRVLWLLPFLVPVLCASGLRGLLAGRRAPLVTAAGLLVLAGAVTLQFGLAQPRLLGPLGAGLRAGGLPGVHRVTEGWMLSPTLGPLLLSGLTLTAIAAARAPRRRRLAAAALVGLIALDLLREAQVYRSTSPLGSHYPETPAIRAAAAAAGADRALVRPPLFPTVLWPAGVRGVGSYGALHSGRLVSLLGALGQPVLMRQLLRPSDLPPAWRDALSVRAIVEPAGGPAPPRDDMQRVHAGPDAQVWRVDGALPRARWHPPEAVVEVADLQAALQAVRAGIDPRRRVILETGAAATTPAPPTSPAPPAPPASTTVAPPGAVEVLLDEPERIDLRLSAPRGGVLVLADSWAPGWTCATADGATLPILPAQVALRGVRIPAGFDGALSFRYRTPRLALGLIVSALAGLAALGLGVAGRRA